MNAIVQGNTSTAVAALKSLKQGIQNVQQTMARRSSNPFLRMLKDGEWVYGQEDIIVEGGSLWAANPLSIMHGWTAWKRAKEGEKVDNSGGPLGEIMVPQTSPLPPKDSLKDVGAEWKYQTSIEFKCLNGTDKGEQVLYKASSAGGSAAMDDLVKAISRQLDEDESAPVPVVKFGYDTYNHKVHGKTYVPIIEVVSWLPLTDAMPEVDEPVKEEPKKVEAAKRTRSVPATKAEAPAEEDDELAKLERELIAKKLAKEAAAKQETVAVDPKELRRQQLLAEMAALEADEGKAAQPETAQADAPKDGQPLRRRRS
jgi:hypothetical protein